MRTNLSIDGERLWTSIAESAKIGTGPRGGLRRLTLTEDDKAMRDLFASWAVAAGYGVIVDQLGSMFARREGSQPKLPPVLIGSIWTRKPLVAVSTAFSACSAGSRSYAPSMIWD